MFLRGFVIALLLGQCSPAKQADQNTPPSAGEQRERAADRGQASPRPSVDDAWADDRRGMVQTQLEARGIEKRVREAMAEVPREKFVPKGVRHMAYEDHPLPIGHDVTISQPYIVALMTELADVEPGEKVLEIGTGSGYQAAVLAELGAEVYSIEIIEPLAKQASKRLEELGYDKVHVRHGDGYAGWPEKAPFDAVLVTAAPPQIPEPLERQLAVGGNLVIPVGRMIQELKVITRRGQQDYRTRTEIPVRFVPMTGKAQQP